MITVIIAGQEYGPRDGSFSIESRVGERTVAEFVIDDPTGEKVFRKGQPVRIKQDNEVIFSGVIDTALGKIIDGKNYKRHAIECTDYHYAADKRVVAAAYEKTKAGEIVRDKSGERTIGTVLAAEGIFFGGDVSRTEQSRADFEQGTLYQVTTDDNALVLDKYETGGIVPTALDYTESGEDFEEGELDGVVAGEDGLELEEVESPTFTRASKAYLSDSTEVDAGVARFEDGKFGQAVLVEEGTGNLFVNPDFDTNSDWGTGLTWYASGGIDNGAYYECGYVWNFRQTVTITKGVDYTVSIFIRKNPTGNGTGRIGLALTDEVFESNGSNVLNKTYTAPDDGKWHRMDVAFKVVGTGTTSLLVYFLQNGGTGTTDFDRAQLEQKPYATSFADGTRSPETLTIPTAGVLNPQEGAVACWVKLSHLNPNDYNAFFTSGDVSAPGPRILIMREVGGGNVNKIRVWDGDGSSEAILTSVTTLQAGIWYYVAFTWSPSGRKLYVNGVLEASNIRSNNLGFATLAKIGSWQSSGYLNGLIDELAISDYAPTDEEIADWYEADAPIPITEHTTYLLRFDNDFVVGKGGARKSLPLDLSSVGTVKTSEIGWQATTPTDTSVKVETSLSTDGGQTWGAWQQATNGGSIPGIIANMDLSNAKLKTRATLETEDTSVTPVLESLSISLTGEKTGLVLVYYDDGFRVSPPLDLSAAGIAKTSAISLSATIPTGTSLSVACAINNDATTEPDAEDYQAAISGQPVPVIAGNDDLSGKFLWIKQMLETEDKNTTPKLHSLVVLVETIQIIDDGPELEEAVFNYIPVSQALDALAERSGMWWRIDENRRLHFVERGKYAAPWTATAADMLENSVAVEHSASKYRNQQIIKGPVDLTSPQTEIMHGDGEQTTFTVGYSIAKVPTVEVDTGSGFALQTVGIKGIDKDKQWYWNGGDPTITQDSSGTALSATGRIRITYQGEFPILIVSRNNTAILDRQAVEGIGTGIVEDVRNEPQQGTREAAFQLASQLLEKYSVIGRILRFTTRRGGLQPGQLLPVYLPSYGLVAEGDGAVEMLIESVVVRDNEDGVIFYDIVAVEGPEQGSWTKVFDEIVKRGELKVREGVGVGEVVIMPRQFSKTWTEEETPNIFRELYPAADLDPAGTLYPSFAPEHRVRYLAWFSNGTELGRKAVTQQAGADTDEIFSLTYLESGEALGEITSFGWVGGIEATAASGTGIQVDKQAVPGGPVEKTVLESWQVEKRDYKWSA